MTSLTTLELCAGGGGQSLGLEQAGVGHAAAVELDEAACATLKLNRPAWRVIQDDVRSIDGRHYSGVDIVSGGVPCPPFSIAGKQLGHLDERDLFPEALRIIGQARPAVVMLENVKGLASRRFAEYRRGLFRELATLGYVADWRLLNASNYGVPQLRPRFVLVALRESMADDFAWPAPCDTIVTVGEALRDDMAANGWPGAEAWSRSAGRVAPTIVGGSKKHGGPDLGPSRARAEWLKLRVDGRGIADCPPDANTPHDHIPRLTTRMVARLQGFPSDWVFGGRKTAAYRQVGNAFPPPVAKAIADQVVRTLTGVPSDELRQLRLAGARS